jgi:hypothetical protein
MCACLELLVLAASTITLMYGKLPPKRRIYHVQTGTGRKTFLNTTLSGKQKSRIAQAEAYVCRHTGEMLRITKQVVAHYAASGSERVSGHCQTNKSSQTCITYLQLTKRQVAPYLHGLVYHLSVGLGCCNSSGCTAGTLLPGPPDKSCRADMPPNRLPAPTAAIVPFVGAAVASLPRWWAWPVPPAC